MRSLRLVFLSVFVSILALVVSPSAKKLLAQSSSVTTDSPIQTPLASNKVAMKSVLQPDPEHQAKTQESYGKLPLSFEANQGQADSQVKFITHTGAYSLFLAGDEAVLALHGAKAKNKFPVETRVAASPADTKPTPNQPTESILRMKLRHANPNATVTGVDELAGKSNYFIGNDPAKWRTNVPTYSKVRYEAIYSGIDLVYYGNQRQLEYDFIVAPGADPRNIAFDISGASRIRKDARGDLLFKTGEDEIRWHKPVVYQEKDGTRNEIAASYTITAKNRIGFELAKYDASSPLYIDPLVYSTYLGGSGNDQGRGIAIDRAGNAYITGFTYSTDFPTTPGSVRATCAAGCITAFVAKINAAGSALVYSTYLGGSAIDFGSAIAVDSAGNAYVTGNTYSTDFPVTPGAFQTVCNGGSNCATESDAFVTKLNATGSALVYSTYLGGRDSDSGFGIAVDHAGDAYVTGLTSSTDFPTKGPLQPTSGGGVDAFVTKLNATGSALVYSTYLGGSGGDASTGIALDSAGNAYIVGNTCSTDFPIMNPLQRNYGGGYASSCGDAFVSKINATGSALVYSTYLGGRGNDFGYGIAVGSAGNAYVTGWTTSRNFPTTSGALKTFCPGGPINCSGIFGFVTELAPTGSALVYSTYLGAGGTSPNGIAVDSSGKAYITGYTTSAYFPTKNAVQSKYAGSQDAFVAKLNASGSALFSSTYLGGSALDYGAGVAVDNAGNSYVVGATASTNFPTMNSLQPTNAGGNDTFVAKLRLLVRTTIKLSSAPNPSAYGQAVTFTATITSSVGSPPDGETVTFMKGTTVLGTRRLSGGSASFTTSALPVGNDYIKAVYGGDSDFASSKATVTQVVN
jgi:Bacterial Ig-like domain (group 3)/Beta-propeller repeat